MRFVMAAHGSGFVQRSETVTRPSRGWPDCPLPARTLSVRLVSAAVPRARGTRTRTGRVLLRPTADGIV